MDPQIAAQFLATLAQVAGTIFAIYITGIILVLQDKELARLLFSLKLFTISFGLSCVGLCSQVILGFVGLFYLGQTLFFSASMLAVVISTVALSLSSVSLNVWPIMYAKRALVGKQKRKKTIKKKTT